MKVLGISAYYHDSASALVVDGEIIAAAQEERFTRIKHDSAFPKNAIQFCLAQAGLRLDQIDLVAFYDEPKLKFSRILKTYAAFAPRGYSAFRQSLPLWLGRKLFQIEEVIETLAELAPQVDWRKRLRISEHHLSHAASAFYPSPFHEAAVLTLDGVGEWATASLAIGRENRLDVQKEIRFPHSVGLLYSAFTQYTGFKVNSGEYKVMGLAPYGEPEYASLILEKIVDLKPDGSFHLDQSYFDYCSGLEMTSAKFHRLFGGPPRRPDEPLTQKHMDLAASVQKVTEEIVLRLTRSIAHETGIKNLCLAGGVALNCVANGKIQREGSFDKIWIQPAAGDAGGALGAALLIYYRETDARRSQVPDGHPDLMQGAFLGPEFEQGEIEVRLRAAGARFEVLSDEALLDACALGLSEGKALGWMQGRMEFGPRALGGRSILADARSTTMQSVLNLKVKFRESFRPFAPSVLRESVSEWFELEEDSPYMLLVSDVRKDRRRAMTPEQQALFGIDKLNVPRSDIPAVTHVDYSARIQTVHSAVHGRYYQLISKFNERTGCPVLVNTSFNVRGEPIVCTPEDAFRCFMGTGIELLAVGNCLLRKSDQSIELVEDYKNRFELD